MDNEGGPIQRQPWEALQASGLLWVINRTLHLFGWVIVFECEPGGRVVNVYPARTSFRGFDDATEDEGFRKVHRYLREHAAEIANDTERT